jgi:hypothetical protein
MAHKFVVVFTTAGGGQAAIIQTMLQAAGIPAQTSQEGAGAAYGLTVGPLGLVDILVPDTHAEAAQRLLAAMQRGDLEGDPGLADSAGSEPDLDR